MPFEAIARSFARRSWQDDLADMYRAIFRRSEYVSGVTEDRARAMMDVMSRELDRLSNQAGSVWARADRRSRRHTRDAARRLESLERGLTRHVRATPFRALAAAAATGVILGLLTSRS